MQNYINLFGRLILNNSSRSQKVISNKFYICRHLCSPVESRREGVTERRQFHINDLLKHINSGKEFYLKQLKNVFSTIEFENLQSNNAILLLRCCGAFVPDSSREQRNEVCQKLFRNLQKANNLNTNILNTYIRTCTENGVSVYSKEFLENNDVDKETIQLLMENSCQMAKLEDAFEILSIMKNRDIPLESDSANDLILVNTIRGGLKAAEAALNTIRSAQIPENRRTKLSIYKGLIRRRDFAEFKKYIQECPIFLNEEELLQLIEEVGLNGVDLWLSEIEPFYKNINITRDIESKIEKICVHLVHMNQTLSAMSIYTRFVTPFSDVPYGFSILKEMLHQNNDINFIVSLAKSLVEKEQNLYILESLTHLALKYKYEKEAWTLLQNLEVVRIHYFWPLLVKSGKNDGETGIFDTLARIRKFPNIKLDNETFLNYVLPYCRTESRKLLLKFQHLGFTIREVLSPILIHLLKQKKVDIAAGLCKQYNVNISGDHFVTILADAWASDGNNNAILSLLARYCESSRSEQDLVGSFLIQAARHCESDSHIKKITDLLKLLAEQRLRITSQSAETIQETLDRFQLDPKKTDLGKCIHELVDIGLKMDTSEELIPHPKNMDLDSLECHLIELREKNKETRGLLRKLIQMHAKNGNITRVEELRTMFKQNGYEETAGMRSSIMHSYVQGKHLENSLLMYKDLKKNNPDFYLDSFKFIDLAKLLCEKDQFDDGMEILKNEFANCKKVGNPNSIVRNCRELLLACKTTDKVEAVFEILSRSKLVQMNNVILGCVLRIYLNSGDLAKTIDKFEELSKEYRCTPLQVEVIRTVAKSKNSSYLQRVFEVTQNIHGHAAAQVGLIAALAENGQETALFKTFMNIETNIQGLLINRCKRWTEEQNLVALKCLANVLGRLPNSIINVGYVYKCIVDIYELYDDLDGAREFLDTIETKNATREMELHNLRDRIRKCVENTNICT